MLTASAESYCQQHQGKAVSSGRVFARLDVYVRMVVYHLLYDKRPMLGCRVTLGWVYVNPFASLFGWMRGEYFEFSIELALNAFAELG